ncbi:MAG: CAP domain-containing protein [Methanoregula sp.]
MVCNTCPRCGAVTEDPKQIFCTKCGMRLPEITVAGKIGGIPAWALAGAAILVIFIILAVLVGPGLISAVTGSSSAGSSVTGQALATSTMTPLPSIMPVPTTLPETTISAGTTVPTTVPTTASPTVSVKRTRVTVATSQTYTVAALNPEATGTSQITLAVTQIPSQPSSSTYTSSNPEAPYIDPTALEARIHELINIERQQNGLSTLSYDSFLADIARGHSYDMSLRNYFEHTDPEGRNAHDRGNWAGYPCIRDYGTYYTEGISENLYQGYRYSNYATAPNGTIVSYKWNTLEYVALQAVNGWMNSEGHRANILNDKLQQEGIGVAFSSDDKVYVTENFC